MKNVLTILSLLFIGISLHAQTVLFTEDFEGATHAFTLNTPDESSVAGTAGNNYWVVNNAYAGGTVTVNCMGSPLTATLPATDPQPSAMSDPNGNYMHIVAGEAANDNVNNANFIPADGFCFFPENKFAAMTSDFSTQGYTGVALDFWWLCEGGPNSYGEIYYSVDAGTTWTQAGTLLQFYNSPTWQLQTLSDNAFDNQATLRLGFRFVSDIETGSVSDPSFGVDELEVTGTASTTFGITSSIAFNSLCNKDFFTVNFTSTGSFNANNVYSVQLSDAAGSFSNPVVLGSLASNANAGSIATNVPLSALAGSGYRLRVNGSNPLVTGADNGNDVEIIQVDTTVGVTGSTLSSNAPNASYQWLDCSNGSTISGEINNSFTPSQTGSYMVEVEEFGCVDTSGCRSIIVTGTQDLNMIEGFSIYPNPARQKINIDFAQQFKVPVVIKITDIYGKVILNRELAMSNKEIDISALSDGVYHLSIYAGDKSAQRSFVKR